MLNIGHFDVFLRSMHHVFTGLGFGFNKVRKSKVLKREHENERL